MRHNELYWDNLFNSQMEDWLDFAWSNRNNRKYKSYQGERIKPLGKTKPLGSINKIRSISGLKTSINTHHLYKDWNKKVKICLLFYPTAVNEMHILFDYMEHNGFEVFE